MAACASSPSQICRWELSSNWNFSRHRENKRCGSPAKCATAHFIYMGLNFSRTPNRRICGRFGARWQLLSSQSNTDTGGPSTALLRMAILVEANSGAAFLSRSSRPDFFPWTLRALRSGFVAINDAVVLISFADGPQRFVVQARQPESFFQFFAELLQGLQMVGGRGNFGFRSLQHLLVAAINELGNFTVDEVSGVRKYLDTVVAIFLNGCRHAVLLQEHASLHARRFDQIEAVVAKPLYGVFE